jgi:hypothetical protein
MFYKNRVSRCVIFHIIIFRDLLFYKKKDTYIKIYYVVMYFLHIVKLRTNFTFVIILHLAHEVKLGNFEKVIYLCLVSSLIIFISLKMVFVLNCSSLERLSIYVIHIYFLSLVCFFSPNAQFLQEIESEH